MQRKKKNSNNYKSPKTNFLFIDANQHRSDIYSYERSAKLNILKTYENTRKKKDSYIKTQAK
jgi:hypothetical protein